MGLHLCILDGADEIDRVEVGSYDDFAAMRDYVAMVLERGWRGSRFPTFMLHSDREGVWTPEQCFWLERELTMIAAELRQRLPVAFHAEWQREAAQSIDLVPKNAFESFIDVDGHFLLARLLDLVAIARKSGLPIVFQ